MIRCISCMAVTLIFAATATCGDGRVVTVKVPQSGQPAAAKADAAGTIHLLFHSEAGPQYVGSHDDGRTFSKPLGLIDPKSQRPGLEFTIWDMAVDRSGRVHVALGTNAWQLKLPQEQWGFFYTQLEQGAPAFTAIRNINRKPSEGFSLAVGNDGQVTACWMADKLYANVSKDHGRTFAPYVEFDPTLDPCNCCTTSAAYAADGRLAVLYREETNNERDMYLAQWDQTTGDVSRTRVSKTPWKIDACPMSYYQISRVDDGFTAVWPTKGRVYFARLDSKGKPRSPVEIETPGTTDTRTGMLALTAADGTLVAWKKANQLNWQFYDQKGRASGLQGSAPSAGKGVAGVVTKDGRFVLFL